MVIAKCKRCLATGTGSSFEEASNDINHARGLSRGVPCGPSFNKVIQVGGTPKPKTKKSTPKPKTKPKVEKSSSPISEDTKE